MFTNSVLSFAAKILLTLAIVFAQGCMAGQYAANECTMQGSMTRDECIKTCGNAGLYGGYCAIPLPLLMDDDGKCDPYYPTNKWSCFPINEVAAPFYRTLPSNMAGLCPEVTVELIQISPPSNSPR